MPHLSALAVGFVVGPDIVIATITLVFAGTKNAPANPPPSPNLLRNQDWQLETSSAVEPQAPTTTPRTYPVPASSASSFYASSLALGP
jgi:hypothetical protein